MENLSYKGILKNINFKVNKGEVVAIIGKNGAGKTTLAKACAGVIKKHKGKIKGSRVMLAMQDVDYQLFAESVESELALGQKKPSMDVIRSTMEQVGIDHLGKRHPLSLSGGQKQRVIIGASIVGDYDTLIFDEPTSGLDSKNMKKVADLIERASSDRGIVVITHDFELIAQIATRAVLMEDGGIMDDFHVSEENRNRLVSIFEGME